MIRHNESCVNRLMDRGIDIDAVVPSEVRERASEMLADLTEIEPRLRQLVTAATSSIAEVKNHHQGVGALAARVEESTREPAHSHRAAV